MPAYTHVDDWKRKKGGLRSQLPSLDMIMGPVFKRTHFVSGNVPPTQERVGLHDSVAIQKPLRVDARQHGARSGLPIVTWT